jgi:hypothetical protein
MAFSGLDALVATYAPRQSQFVVDESSASLGQENRDDQDYSRPKISQRDLGSLSVIASLQKVQYGTWAKESDACLIAFRFQF